MRKWQKNEQIEFKFSAIALREHRTQRTGVWLTCPIGWVFFAILPRCFVGYLDILSVIKMYLLLVFSSQTHFHQMTFQSRGRAKSKASFAYGIVMEFPILYAVMTEIIGG